MKKTLYTFIMLLLVAGTTDVARAQLNSVPKCKTCGDAIAACPYKGKHPKQCNTCGKTIDKCPYKGKHPKQCKSCGKTVYKCPYKGKHPVAPSGYNVMIISNAGSDATLYVDGTNFGNSSGAYMKTGSHSVTLTAEGYEDINQTINVDKNHTWFSFTLTERSADALYQLGDDYLNGKSGYPKDHNKAVKWFRKSADQGNSSGQNDLGFCYYMGYGVERSYTEAVKWYRLSANQGNAYGQYNLGLCYEYGYGVEKDLTEAEGWYHKAADQGHEDAKSALKRLINYQTKYVRKF